jgi:fluoride exporter
VTALLVAVGAALGAPTRFLVGHFLDHHRFAVGTLLVNVVGSTLLGLFAGWGLAGHGLALLGVGFCGGLTTYSAFAVRTHQKGWVLGTTYASVTILLSLAGSVVGFALVS